MHHIISFRAHWQGNWDKGQKIKAKWGRPLQYGKYTFARAGVNCPICKLCHMLSSGSLQAIYMADILCTDSRTHYSLLKCPWAHDIFIAENLVTENF